MRSLLFCLVTLVIAQPVSADGLLPNNLPSNWKIVDPSEAGSESQDLHHQIRVNTENGDMLIASQYPHPIEDDDASNSAKQIADLAQTYLKNHWPQDSKAKIVRLRARASALAGLRTTYSKTGTERKELTERPVVLTTFILESSLGSMMANGISFEKDGETHVIQHVSSRPISDKVLLHLASWAMRRAKPQDQ